MEICAQLSNCSASSRCFPDGIRDHSVGALRRNEQATHKVRVSTSRGEILSCFLSLCVCVWSSFTKVSRAVLQVSTTWCIETHDQLLLNRILDEDHR